MSPQAGQPPKPGREPSAWSTSEARFSKSLGRGLAVLSCFTPQRTVLGIADLADELGMSRSTTHRYVVTLLELGYLEQLAARKYRLGLRVTDLGMSALAATGLREQARPHLHELRRRTSCSASLGVLDGPEILYVDRVRSFRASKREIDLGIDRGSRLPAHATAMGKLLLANLSSDEQQAWLAEAKLTGTGPNTITSKRALREQFEEIRTHGLARSDEELAAGLYAIAAPIRDEADEVVAAINLAADRTMTTLRELVDGLAPQLLSTAHRISLCLGNQL